MNIDQIKRLERAGSTFTHGAAPGSDDETDHPGFPVPVIIRCPKCESLCAARPVSYILPPEIKADLDAGGEDGVQKTQQWLRAKVCALAASAVGRKADRLTDEQKCALAVMAGVPVASTSTDPDTGKSKVVTVPCNVVDDGRGGYIIGYTDTRRKETVTVNVRN